MAHAGFEPAISALRGRCPRPLDECAAVPRGRSRATTGRGVPAVIHVHHAWRAWASTGWLGIVDSNHGLQIQSLPSYR